VSGRFGAGRGVTCEGGEAGLDGRLGETSGRRVPADRDEEVERFYRERYQGFTVKHFHENLVKDHGFGWGYTWTKLHLQWTGVVAASAPLPQVHTYLPGVTPRLAEVALSRAWPIDLPQPAASSSVTAL
jgi:hypothetical protein